MRNVVNNNFGYVTMEFAYSAGTGYAIAYGGRDENYLWMNPVSIPNCKSRDEAELRALYILVNGDPKKDTYAEQGLDCYKGFTKNARVQLLGFDALEKGIYNNHRANTALWKEVLGYFGQGKNGLKFDLIRINDTFSKAIHHANTYGWTSPARAAHAAAFKAMVSGAVKSARAERAAIAKSEAAATAKAESALMARAEAAMKASAKEAA